ATDGVWKTCNQALRTKGSPGRSACGTAWRSSTNARWTGASHLLLKVSLNGPACNRARRFWIWEQEPARLLSGRRHSSAQPDTSPEWTSALRCWRRQENERSPSGYGTCHFVRAELRRFLGTRLAATSCWPRSA